MTLTIDLPEKLASRLIALLPEEERGSFAVSAIADALFAQERDSAECTVAVEEALLEIEAGYSTSFEEEKARWEHQKSVLLTTNRITAV